MGKGSKQRPTDKQKYDVAWERIFGIKDVKEEKKSNKDMSDNTENKKTK
jgi:hypothetical protein